MKKKEKADRKNLNLTVVKDKTKKVSTEVKEIVNKKKIFNIRIKEFTKMAQTVRVCAIFCNICQIIFLYK